MIAETHTLEVDSERIFVVYDGRTGAIVHVHRVITHRGATAMSDEQGEARALEMASRFGQQRAKLCVLRAEKFEGAMSQRVDLESRRLVPETTAVSRRRAKPAETTRGGSTSRRQRR
jgi:hypothetical protein